ncbi:MAG TPA: hypothetical protein VG222_09045 [Vicinamibacterales bacterium]|jgi:hypothetical protein|nr:hypothetical protein [Vicinamibacterales bacterium]
MAVRHRNLMMTVAACGIVMVGTFSVRAALAAARGNRPVEVIAPNQPIAGPPGQKGATYYWLESRTIRQTTRFADLTATAERGSYGTFSTVLTDLAGNEVGRLRVDRADGVHVQLRYAHASGGVLQVAGDPSVQPTLDWANQQAYHLWKDRVEPGRTQLEWQNGMMRPKGAAPRDAGRAILALQTEWAGGLSAKTVRKVVSHHEALPGRFVEGEAFAASLTDGAGAEAGVGYWYARSQLFVWSLPGLNTSGFIGPEHLHATYGGWPFAPDMAWMNLQMVAFHHFKTLINTQRFVARVRTRPNPVLQFFAPTVIADEAGCDDLHWLDGTVLRYCCDDHDRCYEKAGCAASSWWKIWSSWTCDYCNEQVVRCFLRGSFGSGGFGKL